MSKRTPEPFFIPVPWEFFEAWLERRIKRSHVLCALYIAARCFEAKNTGGGVAPIELSTVARLCDVSTETIRRTLHDLRDWAGSIFKLGTEVIQPGESGLRVSQLTRPLHDLSTTSPQKRPLLRGEVSPQPLDRRMPRTLMRKPNEPPHPLHRRFRRSPTYETRRDHKRRKPKTSLVKEGKRTL